MSLQGKVNLVYDHIQIPDILDIIADYANPWKAAMDTVFAMIWHPQDNDGNMEYWQWKYVRSIDTERYYKLEHYYYTMKSMIINYCNKVHSTCSKISFSRNNMKVFQVDTYTGDVFKYKWAYVIDPEICPIPYTLESY